MKLGYHVWEINLLKLGRRRPLFPENAPRAEAATNPRLEQLAKQARAILLFERVWRLVVPPLIVSGFFVCISWTGLWLAVPHWARGLGVLALALGLISALLPL